MKAGKYSIKELFNNKYVSQIVIPEIQRDYVWGKKEVEGLLGSIYEDFENFKKGIEIPQNSQADIEISNAFLQYYKKQKFSCNIGFIYAYNDPQYSGKYFLIDGQQRLTTIYLLLLVLAAEENTFRDKFMKLYTFSELPIIDYRVREASHYLMKEVVTNYSKSSVKITDQPWFYKEYESDKTITSIIANIAIIKEFITQKNIINVDFINYVQDYIEFWYFDTNISEQGEELYIYMNARGEQMQENENLKADLLSKIKTGNNIQESKKEWGKKWEEWQQFFWINRENNPNADKGFNEFINCISGFENYLRGSQIIYTKEEFENAEKGKKNQIAYSDILSIFNDNGLETIFNYVQGLTYLFNEENIKNFKDKYENITWVEKCLSEILLIFNSNTTNWFADIKDSNRGLEHSRMVFIWSLLNYLKAINSNLTTNDEVFRVLRLYYVRFNNYNRSVRSINTDIENIISKGVWKLDGEGEEKKKHKWYVEKVNANEITKYEELIWAIEDHPLNIDGRDAKAINCSHLIDFEESPSLDELFLIKEKFYILFPIIKENGKINDLNYKKLINILIFYGEFWERNSPWYCWNYYFANWKKIIRNIDKKQDPFKSFFEDFKQKSFEEIYNEKVVEFELDEKSTDFAEQIKWYVAKLKEKVWEQGYYIVFEHYNYPNQDKNFITTREILNTKGDFKGGNPQVLSNLID